MEFWRHPSKHWNPDAILTIIAILNLSFHCNHWNSDSILPNIRNPALSLYTLEFLSYPSKRLDSGPFLQKLEFWSNSFTLWNSGPVFLQTGIFSSFFRAFEFWPCSYKHWNSYLILSLETLKLWPYPSKHWNYGPIFIYAGFLILTFKILGFWPYFYKHWNYDLMLPKNEIRALFL